MNDVRILKGYSKAEQKELENAKKHMRCSDLLHDITSFVPDMGFGLIWRKYDKAEPDEQISIIKDIIDFYTDKATFSEPKKYYVHLIRNDDGGYLNRNRISNWCMTNSCQPDDEFQVKFTEQEIKAIDPRYMAFAVPAEADNE